MSVANRCFESLLDLTQLGLLVIDIQPLRTYTVQVGTNGVRQNG